MPQRLEEQYPLYSEKIERARKEGYSDDEIFDHIQGKIVQAMDEGYEMQEIFDYLGSPTPGFELLPEPGEEPSTEKIKPYSIKRMTPEEIAAEEAKMGPIDETTPTRTRHTLEYVDPVSGGINREDEALFQRWYKKIAKRTGLNPDPDAPEHKYDYRGAFLAGEGPDETGHWPSQFKDYDHPNRYVDGVDTITGQRVGQPPSTEEDKLATPTDIEYPQQAPGATIGAPITPGLPGAEIKQAPQRTRMDELIEMGGKIASIVTGKTPEKEAAQAQNILSVAREAGIPVEDARKNYKQIVQQIGLKVAPETAPKLIEEMAMHFMTAPVVAGLLTNPISTGIGLAAFAALDEAENFVATKVKTGKYQAFAGQRFSDLLPEDADQFSKDSIDLLSFIAKFKAFTLPGKLKGKWPEIFNKFTKDTIKTYGIPKKYYFRPSQVDAVYRRAKGQEISPELDEISKDLGINGRDLNKAIKYGLEVEVTAPEIMRAADKPYWAHIKRFFRVRPFAEERTLKRGESTYKVLQPMLEAGKAEAPPKAEPVKKAPPQAPPPEAPPPAAGPIITPPPKGPQGPPPTIAEDLQKITEVPPEVSIGKKIAGIKDIKSLRRSEKRILGKIEKLPDEAKKAALMKEFEAKRSQLTPYEETVTAGMKEIESTLEGKEKLRVKRLRRLWEKNKALPAPIDFQEIKGLETAFGGQQKVADLYSQQSKRHITPEEIFEPAKGGPEESKKSIMLMNKAIELGVPQRTRYGLLAQLSDEDTQKLIDIYSKGKPETEPEYEPPVVIKPAVGQKEIDEVITGYQRRIAKAETGEELGQIRNELKDEGLINETQKKLIDSSITRAERSLLGEEVADVPEEKPLEGEEAIDQMKRQSRVVEEYRKRIEQAKDFHEARKIERELDEDPQLDEVEYEVVQSLRDQATEKGAELVKALEDAEILKVPSSLKKGEIVEDYYTKEKLEVVEPDKRGMATFKRVKDGSTFKMNANANKRYQVIPKRETTQEAQVKETIKEEPKSIKDIAKETGILEPNIRRILGVGTKEGKFERVDKGVYVLRKDGQEIAYIHTGDAVETLPALVEKGFKADMVFLDIPYKTPAVVGGNRGIKYDYITPEQFKIVVDAIARIARSDKTPIIYMYSQARSGLKEMQEYNDMITDQFIPIAKGDYTKLQKDGVTRVRNMRGDIIEPEAIMLLTKSGEFDKAIPNLNFKLVRPKGWQTEKPREMLRSLIEATTEQGEVVLDPFAGSGVTAEQAVEAGRKAVVVEKSEEAVEEHIKPRVEKAAAKAPRPETEDTYIGKNSAGAPIYEDDKGIRYRIEKGIRITEPVQMIPTKEGVITAPPTKRSPEFLSEEELKKSEEFVPEIVKEARLKKAAEAKGYSDAALEHAWNKSLTEFGRSKVARIVAGPDSDFNRIAKTTFRHLDPTLQTKIREHLIKNFVSDLEYAEKYVNTADWWDAKSSFKERKQVVLASGYTGDYSDQLAGLKWDQLPASKKDLFRSNLAKPLVEEAPVEQGEQRALIDEKLTPDEFAAQKGNKTINEWATEVLDKAGNQMTPYVKIDFAGYWEPSKTHPNGAIQMNGPFTQSSLNLRTDQFTPNNILNKFAWNYLTTEPNNIIEKWTQIDNLTNEQKADIIYGRKGVKDVISFGEETKEALEGKPPETVPATEGREEGEAVLPGPGREGGPGRRGPVEEGAEPRPSERGTEGSVLPPKRTGPTEPGREPKPRRVGNNYRISEKDGLDTPRGDMQRFDDNLAAIRTLKQIEAEGRKATPAEQAILVKYVGWGGLPKAFGYSYEPSWRQRRDDLRKLLTDEEWEAAKQSTPNAHFTTPKVISLIYNAAKKFGFKGGRVLEPAAGIGHFIGMMPAEMADRSKITGIEKDIISAKIAAQLYQDQDIRQTGYEKVKLPNNFFDLAVSNVPFGDFSVYDPEYKALKMPIHDWYFIKSLDKVRPGGLVIFVTSRYTMDKKEARTRQMIADKADLVFAVRLPDTAFKGVANTEVVTDILFLRKKVKGESLKTPNWIDTKEITIKDGSDEGKVYVNEYFLNNPKSILGKQSLTGSMYADKQYTVKGVLKSAEENKPVEEIIETSLDDILEQLPENVYEDGSITEKIVEEPTSQDIMGREGDVKDGGFLVKHNTIYQKKGNELVKANFGSGDINRAKALINVKEAVRQLIRVQLEPEIEQTQQIFKERQLDLNNKYDAFVKKYGFINLKSNWKLLEDDPDLPLLQAIEKFDEKSKTATKTPFFSQRTIQRYQKPVKADNPKEALVISLNETAGIDLQRMSSLTGMTEEELTNELQGLIYRDPDGEKWVTEDEYLSGDVKSKLEAAKEAAKLDPQYEKNVEALEKIQPEDIPFEDVKPRLGQTWVTKEDYMDFVQDLLDERGYRRNDVKIDYTPNGTWVVRAKERGRAESAWSKTNYRQSTDSRNKYSLPGVKTTLELTEQAFNGRYPIVKKYNEDGEPIGTDEVKTAEAKRIQDEIQNAFREWLVKDPERRNRLHRQYNDTFNRFRTRTYDGSHLTLPGSNPGIALRPHQRNAIWRIIQGKSNTLLEHVVGAGKTYVMIGAAMEMKRLGIAKKPMILCYKHQVPDFQKSIYELYPAANVLVPTQVDFTPKNRKIIEAKITTGNWDLIVLSHEQFEKLPMSLAAQENYVREQIYELEWGIQELTRQGAHKKDPTVKQLEKAKLRLEAKLQKLLDTEKDTGVTFEELGVDQIFVDEAQKYKNLQYTSTRSRVSGLGDPKGSQRANDLYMKSRYLAKMNEGKGVVFATATPVTNSLVEMFTVLRYLYPTILEDLGIRHFDAWAHQFGEDVTALEIEPTGKGYRMFTRFRRFVNLPELMQIYTDISDIQTQEMLKLPIPTIRGGKPEAVASEASELQKAYVNWLVERAEAIRHGGIDPRDDNMLKITTEGRKAALDIRLVWDMGPDEEGSKLNKAVANIFDIWKRTANDKLTQLVFCDLGTPQTEGFNVYADMKEKLIARGIPKEEIAFIHDATNEAAKQSLFDQVTDGKVRILFGSSEKMGTGMNVQKRLIALHHMDAPWTPASVEQREGRILRQLNDNPEVDIFRYATSGTFDAYMWQTLENKQGFLSQIKRGDIGREIEDIDGRALSYAEMKAIASGDPLVREKIETEIRINELMVQHQAWQKRRRRFEEEAATVPQTIDGYNIEKEVVKEDLDTLEKHPLEEGKFKITLGGKEFEDRKEAGQHIIDTYKTLEPKEDLLSPPYALGNYRGIRIGLNKFRVLNDEITIEGRGKHKIEYNPMQLKMGTGEVSEAEVDPLGLIRRIENKINGFSKELERIDTAIANLREKAELAKKEAEKPFEHAKELREKQSRLAELDAVLGVQDEGMAMADTDADDAEAGLGKPGTPSYIAYVNGEYRSVQGQPVNVRDGFEFFVVKSKDGKQYTVHEKDTGLAVGYGRTIKVAIESAKQAMAARSDEELRKIIDEKVEEIKNSGQRKDFEIAKLSDEAISSEIKQAWGSKEKSEKSLLDVAERVERKSAKLHYRDFNKSLKDYRSKVAKELILRKRIDLTGKRISRGYEGAADLAELVQVYRSPEIELLHVIYTDKDGYILAHNVISSGSPVYVSYGPFAKFIYNVKKRIKRLGADKVHFIHNHPNGVAELSNGDFEVDLDLRSPQGVGEEKLGSLMVIDHGKFAAQFPVSPGKREYAKGRYRIIPGTGRWMERQKNFRVIGPKDVAAFVSDAKSPGRSIVLFVDPSNIIHGWTSVSDRSLLRDRQKVKEMIKAQAKAHDTIKAIIYTTNDKVRDLALNPVGDWLENIVFENDKGDIASMREMLPPNFAESTDPMITAKMQEKRVISLFTAKEPFSDLTPEQEEALDRAKEYVMGLEDEAKRAGIKFGRAFLKQKGFNKKSITQLMRIARLIRNQRARVGTPLENADKVMKMHLDTDKALEDLSKFKAKQLYRKVKRGIVDVSGNIKAELMKFGPQGKAAVINHDLTAGATSWAEVLHNEAVDKIYKKGTWGVELNEDEHKVLNYLIQSLRTIAIDNYKENVKHPRRLGKVHHEDFLDYETFRTVYRNNTGKELSAEKFNELKERAQKYFDVMNEQLTALYNNGLISEAGYDAMIQIGAYELRRFLHHIDPEETYTFGGSRTIQVHNSGIKRLTTGSFELLENDSQKLLYQVIARSQGRIARNKANLALWDLATNVPDNGLVRKARIYGVTEKGTPRFEKTPAGYEAIDVMVEGKKRRLFMPNEWAKEWVMRDPAVDDQVANVIGWITGAKILRPMATGMFAPEFAITNLARDAAHLWLVTNSFSRWLPVAGVQYGKALKAVWKDALLKQGLWREYMKEGGGMSFLSTQGKMSYTPTSKLVENLDYYGTYIGNFSEVLNRLAIMQQEIWNGKSTREAAWIARNYIDFYQGGRWVKMLDTGIPYLSAGVQGTRGIFRAMYNDPQTFTIKLAQIFTLAMGLYFANRFINPECNDAISDSDRVRYWTITTPLKFKDKDGNDRYLYFKIAKDQGQRFFAQLAEQMARGMTGDSVNFDQMKMAFRDFWPIMAPQDLLPPTVDSLLGYSTNKDFWLNKDIWESKYYPVGKIEPRDEYTRYSHPALVKIGQFFNLSPDRLAYSLEQFFTYGNVFTSLVGGGLRAMFNEMPGNEDDRVAMEIIAQMPGVRRVASLTRPVPDVVLKEQSEALRRIYTRRIRQNREVRDWAEQYYTFKKEGRDADAEGPLENATTFIEKQPSEDRERLKKLFKEYPKYDDIPDRGWWLSLREVPAEAKAYLWYSRYRRASDSKKEELDRIRKKMPGMTSDRFMAELRKLQDMDKGNK